MASKSFEEAADLVKNLKRCISNNVVLVGKKGQVLDFEVQPYKMDQVYSQGGILTHANHFVVDPDADAYPKRAKVRDVRLMELLSEKRGEIDVPFIMECMKDHKYWPKAICSHPTFEGDERTYIPDGITVASIIVDFGRKYSLYFFRTALYRRLQNLCIIIYLVLICAAVPAAH